MMNYKNIDAVEVCIGKNTIIESSAKIKGINGKAKKIIIGDNCYIGHNAWIGQYSIIDSIGGMTIGNNCGIGAHSQLWSHVKFGDTLEGSRFLSEKPMLIENDVWFVGHCIVSPIHAKSKSMVLAGGVVTKDLEYNNIYAGSPAKSISEKIGFQFLNISIEDKLVKLEKYLKDWNSNCNNIKIVRIIKEKHLLDSRNTYFALETRTYTKRQTADEISFMKFLLPDKAKFIPHIIK